MPSKTSLMLGIIPDDRAIIEGGMYLIITVLLAMVIYLVFLPLLAVIPDQLKAIDPAATARFATMGDRTDTSITLFALLPIISIAIAAIYFIMRAIKRQGYSEYDR